MDLYALELSVYKTKYTSAANKSAGALAFFVLVNSHNFLVLKSNAESFSPTGVSLDKVGIEKQSLLSIQIQNKALQFAIFQYCLHLIDKH